MPKSYEYVGPPEIRAAAKREQLGVSVRSAEELAAWVRNQPEWDGDSLTATFVVVPDGTLRVAPRRSEHVGCALDGAVLAAGELTICLAPQVQIIAATNQSTGYCPQPSCWDVARAALGAIAIACPEHLTSAYEFRRCPSCGERNLVKEDWFVCVFCDTDLPREWNFD
ncbi:hypothetical protein [Enhygromyxa salina]|uniref:hypothetical protein n=1 Tax=Enhygromyxa salina TaxID=215803 RepID=UPI0004E64790|nr:hypothetical protein [Enhygromyxa salina]